MKKTIAFISISTLILAGCSTAGDYYKSVDSSNVKNVEIMQAQAMAEVAKYQALAQIAGQGDATAKVAATMAIALSGQKNTTQAAVAQPMQSEALQWASILVPGVTQGLNIYYNTKASINANNNATALGMNTNSTFSEMAKEINNPVIVTQPTPTIVTQPEPIIVKPEIIKPEVVQPQVITTTIQ